MSEATKYLYRVSANRFGLQVEVGTYDPQRWARSQPDSPAGMTFGETAEVLVREYSFGTHGEMKAEVSMGSIGSHSIEVAARRIDVYHQAMAIATFVNDQLDAGETLEAIGAFLSGILALSPSAPADGPFLYSNNEASIAKSVTATVRP